MRASQEAPTFHLSDLLLAATTTALAIPATSSFVLDRANLSLTWPNLTAAAVAQLLLLGLALSWTRLPRLERRPGTAAIAIAFLATMLIALRLAWPTMLPVSTSVDEVNNWLLVDYLVRHGTLPRGDELASLVEMADYPFAPDLLIALAARATGISSLYLLHPFAALYLASGVAFASATVAELTASSAWSTGAKGWRTWLPLLVVPVVLWPAAYTLGAIANDFFLAQVYGVSSLLGAAYWCVARQRLGAVALAPLGLAGAALIFSYPSLLPIYGLGTALALLRSSADRRAGLGASMPTSHDGARAGVGAGLVPARGGGVEATGWANVRMGGRGQAPPLRPVGATSAETDGKSSLWTHWADVRRLSLAQRVRLVLVPLAAVGVPLGLLAGVYLLRRVGTGLDVVRQGGVATAPTFETLPPISVLLAAVGLLWSTRERRAWPLAAFAWAAIAQTVLFAIAYRYLGELSRYAVEKMLYVLVPLLAVGSTAVLLDWLRGRSASPLPLGAASRPGGQGQGEGLLGRGAATANARRALPIAAALILAVCFFQATPHLIRPVGARIPSPNLTADLIAAARWLQEHAPGEAPLYLTPDHLPAYWTEIGLLKRDRTAAALPRFHDRTRPPGEYWAWSASRNTPTYAVATRDGAALAGPEVDVVFQQGDAAVLRRLKDGPGAQADATKHFDLLVPDYRWIGDDLVLIAARPSARRLTPGETLTLDVQLGAVAAVTEPRAIVARLRDWQGQQRAEATAELGNRVLEPAHRTTLSLTLPLDPALPRGAYTIELLAFRLPSWDSIPARAEPRREAPSVPLTAGSIAVMPAGALPPLDAAPKRAIGARFGGQIDLLGVDRLERSADAIDLSLLWRAETRPERDYSVFVHALDSAGKLVAQSDGYPWSGAYPTSAWEPDQPVRDSYHLALPPNTTGPLRIVVGLYRLDTGERLKAGGADAIEVGRLDS